MSSFGVSESMIIGGVLLINSGRVTEGFAMSGMGIVFGFVRYTTWIGMRKENNSSSYDNS